MERVALAEAIEIELGKRHGGDRITEQAGKISCLNEFGQTRDIAAKKVGLGSGKTLEAASNLRAQG